MSGKPFQPPWQTFSRPAEQTAEHAQKFLASIVEQSEDAIIGCTPDAIIVSWNRGAEKLFGYGSQEIIGKNLAVLATDEAAPSLKTAVERMKRGKAIFPFDGSGMTKDGRCIEISCSASPVKDATEN
jgi:PAS domain S-box